MILAILAELIVKSGNCFQRSYFIFWWILTVQLGALADQWTIVANEDSPGNNLCGLTEWQPFAKQFHTQWAGGPYWQKIMDVYFWQGTRQVNNSRYLKRMQFKPEGSYSYGLSEHQYHSVFWFKLSSLTTRVSFTPHSHPVNWAQCLQHSCSKMVESRPTSDRSSFRIGRAYFTHPSLCLRHCVFQHNSRWTCHGIWAESTRAWLNHSFQSQRWRVWFLDMRFFRITRSILDLSNRSVVCFYGFNDCNSVHYRCGRRSCWYSVSIYSRLTMFSNADATLVGELLSTSVYTVHMLAHDGSNLTNFRTTVTLIIYIADVTLSQENEILHIHSVLANSWSPRMHLGTARGLCLELISVSRHCVDETMLSLKDSRHGLSSIYNFVRHIEQSAIYGTVGRCKVLRKHTVTFQPMLILPESFCRPHPCMRWRCWQLRFLQRRGVTPASDDMLQPNPLLHTECEKEREALFLLRWKVITDYIDRGLHKLVRIYSESQLASSLSFKVWHPHSSVTLRMISLLNMMRFLW